MNLCRIDPSEFDEIYRKMEAAFIREERRDPAPAKELLSHPRYALYHLEEQGDRVGFVAVWDLDGITFVEHLAIDEQHRNRGLGAAALELLKARFPRMVLEVEQPVTEIAARRIGFYERNGFCQNDYPYRQPSYREPGDEIDMILMTYPTPCTDCGNLVSKLYDVVYHVTVG